MPEPIRVMVVDDDPAMCEFLIDFLGRRGYAAEPVQTAEQAVQRFESSPPAAVILDLVMPGEMDGLAALAAFRKIDRTVPVLVLSGQGRTATVVQAMKLGAIDFVSKPFEEADLEAPLLSALRQRQLCREVANLREQLQGEARHTLLYGRSERMLRIRELIDRVADTDIPVLICGESGTGKELVARGLYAKSRRSDRPFVKVNCTGLPADVLESELFGFERGAFTGAMQHRPGKFEFANHGTLFLDELGAMTPSLQAKLLHVLQDGEFSRLGGKVDVHVDVRVIAATNQNLDAAVAAGRFREDLFLRLNEVTIDLPPLRERREEIPALTDFFIKKYSVQYNRPLIEITPPTLQALVNHDWPGNVRELENLAKRVVVLGTESTVLKDLQHAAAGSRHRPVAPASVQPPSVMSVGASVGEMAHSPAVTVAAVAAAPVPSPMPPIEPGQYSLKDVSRHAAREAERELILRMLQHTRWNRKEAAEILGISYKALLYKIKENGLDRAS
jgi:two-component system, NtrC family, response regulator AtoC